MKRAAIMVMMMAAILALLAACSGRGRETPAADQATAEAIFEPGLGGSPTPAAAALPEDAPAATTALEDPPPSPAQPTPAQPTQAPAPAAPTAAAPSEPPAPACTPGAPLTPADMEGPYYLAGAPERPSLLEPGMPGTRLVISGYVFHADCTPAAGARLDFWQADASGQYDLQGYRLRGQVSADANGFYRIETVLPAVYGGRPRHIHVKVVTPTGQLTSQLYFPGDSPSPAQTVALVENGDTAAAAYNFMIE